MSTQDKVFLKGCWTIDEKMGQTYVHFEEANTLAARDYKQPQAVVFLANSSGNGVAETLDSYYGNGTGARSGTEREFIVVEKNAKTITKDGD